MNVQVMAGRTRRLALAATVGTAIVGSIAVAPAVSGQGQYSSPRDRASGVRLDPKQIIDRRVAMMTQNLSLTGAQRTKIRAILTDEQTELEMVRKNAAVQRPEDRAAPPPEDDRGGPPPEVRAVIDRREKRIEGVLNPQQLVAYHRLVRQQRENGIRAE